MSRQHTESEMMDKIEKIEDELEKSENYSINYNISSIAFETPSYSENKNDNIVVYLEDDTKEHSKTEIVNFLLLEIDISVKLDSFSGNHDHMVFELV